MTTAVTKSPCRAASAQLTTRLVAIAALVTVAPVRAQSFDPHGKSVIQIARALDAGETSSVALVRHYLARIEAYDDTGPAIQAITQINPKVYVEARLSDQRRRRGRARSPLDGVPIALKENIDVRGMPTTAGSVALALNVPKRDAVIVQKLRAAGVVVLAKTNMSELAASYGRLGYGSAGGQTRNPVNLARSASGSSSGSAAAVAAGFAPMALGTDTSGSVRGPAASVGAVGLRGTLGEVSIAGVVPLSESFDVVGPITPTAAGAALLFSVMSDSYDFDYEALTSPIAAGMRFGFTRQFSSANAEVAAALEDTLAVLEGLGASVVEVTLSGDLAYAWTSILGPLGALELVHDIDGYLAGTGPFAPKTVSQLASILESPYVTSLPTPPNQRRVDGLRAALEVASGYGGPEYRELVEEVRPALRAELAGLFEAEALDTIVLPSMACPASPIDYRPDPTWACGSGDEYAPSYVSPATGFPEVTLPVAIDSVGLPIGMSLLGLPASEDTLLHAATALQQATDAVAATPSTPPL